MQKTRSLASRANTIMAVAVTVFIALTVLVVNDRFDAEHEAHQQSDRSYQTLLTLGRIDIAVRDAETGQRGFLLTGNEDYLRPYTAALDRIGGLQGTLQVLTSGDPAAEADLRKLQPLIQMKFAELAQTIELRRKVGIEAALGAVRTNAGREEMTAIEAVLDHLLDDAQARLARQRAAFTRRVHLVRVACYGGLGVLTLALLLSAMLLNLSVRRGIRLEAQQRALLTRLRTSIDSISQGVAVFDADMRLADWNPCFGELLSVPPDLLRAGTSYRAFVENYADPAPFLETAEQISEAAGEPGQVVSYERVTPDRRVLEIRRTFMRGGGFVLTISDMSKRAESEAMMRETQKMQAVGQLTGGLAHDFNNLLTVVMGNLEFARDKLDPSQAAVAVRLERAMWAAQRGATLTAQLLAFARRQPLMPMPIDLSATMPELIPLLRRTLGEHIDVRFVDSAGLWPAMADRAQLESAVLNLALNARDAMPGGGRLTIELSNRVLDAAYARSHSEVTQGDYVMLAVSDTGHGMPPDVLARVFEPFFTTKPDGAGSGLGLPMVFGFVKQSGGHIKLYSEPNEGTTVRIYLPRALRNTAAQRIDKPAEVPRGNATVLLVEDEAAVREIAVAILRDLGYRVLEAADAEDALRVFGNEAPNIDLLLSDVVLPGRMRGRELADYILRARPGMRVLFMSGYTENAIVHHGRLDDGVNLISKPFKREQLAQKVAEVLGTAADMPDTGSATAAAADPPAPNVVDLRRATDGKS